MTAGDLKKALEGVPDEVQVEVRNSAGDRDTADIVLTNVNDDVVIEASSTYIRSTDTVLLNLE